MQKEESEQLFKDVIKFILCIGCGIIVGYFSASMLIQPWILVCLLWLFYLFVTMSNRGQNMFKDRKIHFVDSHFDFKTKCGKFGMLRKKTMFKKYVTCAECLKLI